MSTNDLICFETISVIDFQMGQGNLQELPVKITKTVVDTQFESPEAKSENKLRALLIVLLKKKKTNIYLQKSLGHYPNLR